MCRLPRGFPTVKLVDCSTLPRLGVDNIVDFVRSTVTERGVAASAVVSPLDVADDVAPSLRGDPGWDLVVAGSYEVRLRACADRLWPRQVAGFRADCIVAAPSKLQRPSWRPGQDRRHRCPAPGPAAALGEVSAVAIRTVEQDAAGIWSVPGKMSGVI